MNINFINQQFQGSEVIEKEYANPDLIRNLAEVPEDIRDAVETEISNVSDFINGENILQAPEGQKNITTNNNIEIGINSILDHEIEQDIKEKMERDSNFLWSTPIYTCYPLVWFTNDDAIFNLKKWYKRCRV